MGFYMSKSRVVVAMSGGVDSSVAACLLKEQGYDVVGISMQLYDHGESGEERFDSCCSLTDMHDARVVAHKMGFPHFIVNYEEEFRDGVIDYFADEYSKGRTPNPCVMCNSKLKFDHLLAKAEKLGANWVATGHYALIEHEENKPSKLYRAHDLQKDQSYFLFGVKQEFLKKALFPLAGMDKSEVRELARKYGLGERTSEKKESQEICFVTSKRYTDFLEKEYPNKIHGKGEIVDRNGVVLGHHDGIYQFTVGQRKGLGINTQTPKYVKYLDAEKNRVVVDDLSALAADKVKLVGMNWLVDPDSMEGRDVKVVARYHARPIASSVKILNDHECEVEMFESARWISPGQAAVLYDGDQVLGGGFIAAPKYDA